MPVIDYDYIFESFRSRDLNPLYRIMYPGLVRYAVRVLGERLAYLAEDTVQDAIYKSYIQRRDFENHLSWRSWLIVVIRNRISELQRRAGYGDVYSEYVQRHGETAEDSVARTLIEQETYAMIFGAIDSLPEKYREIFDLNFEKGMKLAEIAELLGVAEITVKKRKSRMLEILRSRLGPGIFPMVYLLFLPEPMAETCLG